MCQPKMSSWIYDFPANSFEVDRPGLGGCEVACCILRLKCGGTRAETRFRLSAKRTSPFKSAGGVSSVDYWQPRCAHQR